MSDPSKATTTTVLPLPFTGRWQKELELARNQQGWHVHAAGSQHGKTTANRDFFMNQKAERAAAGASSCPVGQAWAADGKAMILRSLAGSIGGQRFANLSHPELRLPPLMKQLGTRLIIVNNAHNLEWRQWQELLTLDDICAGEHAIRLTIVLSGVHKELGLVKVPKQAEVLEQIVNRIRCYKEIPGHSAEEVKVAMELLLRPKAPGLLRHNAFVHNELVFDLLTRPDIDLAGRKTVATLHLVELSRRIIGLHLKDRKAPTEQVVRKAFEHYSKNRTPSAPTPSEAIQRALSRAGTPAGSPGRSMVAATPTSRRAPDARANEKATATAPIAQVLEAA